MQPYFLYSCHGITGTGITNVSDPSYNNADEARKHLEALLWLDSESALEALKGIEGKRLTYRPTV